MDVILHHFYVKNTLLNKSYVKVFSKIIISIIFFFLIYRKLSLHSRIASGMVIQNEKIVRVYSSEEMLAVFSEKKNKKEQKMLKEGKKSKIFENLAAKNVQNLKIL